MTEFDPENWQHWALVFSCFGMAVWGYWQVSQSEASQDDTTGNSHYYDRTTGTVRRR